MSKTNEVTGGETKPEPVETVEVPKSFIENLQSQMDELKKDIAVGK